MNAAALVPPGHGTLRQDDFTVSLRNGALLVKVTPLAEAVIRLAAPDTYERLHALVESRRVELTAVAAEAEPVLFLVSFFSYQPDAPFRPDDLHLLSRGRLLRPQAILSLTPAWGAQRLEQQQTQSAIYVFEAGVDLELPLTVRYGRVESDEWSRILERLRLERGRVRARAGG
ncbi:MAG TPA: hypothetical protein VF212_02775 [Longimicrobiales bacterium]